MALSLGTCSNQLNPTQHLLKVLANIPHKLLRAPPADGAPAAADTTALGGLSSRSRRSIPRAGWVGGVRGAREQSREGKRRGRIWFVCVCVCVCVCARLCVCLLCVRTCMRCACAATGELPADAPSIKGALHCFGKQRHVLRAGECEQEERERWTGWECDFLSERKSEVGERGGGEGGGQRDRKGGIERARTGKRWGGRVEADVLAPEKSHYPKVNGCAHSSKPSRS